MGSVVEGTQVQVEYWSSREELAHPDTQVAGREGHRDKGGPGPGELLKPQSLLPTDTTSPTAPQLP